MNAALPEVLGSPEGMRFARSTVELDLRASLVSEILRRAAAHDAGQDPGAIPTALERLAHELDDMPIADALEASARPEANAAAGDPVDGEPVPAATRDAGERPGAPQPATEKEKTPMAAKGSLVTWNGKTRTIKEWANELGVTDSGMRLRLKKGQNPDGSPREGGDTKPAKPARKASVRKPPERVEVKVLARIDVPALLKALGLEVQVMEGTLEGWEVGAWRTART